MYSASWLMMAAQVLLLSNWIAGFGGLVAFAFMYFLRVQKEEAMMLKQFGKQYQAYMEQTGRVIPKTS
jgi:protein-S-isoprenylcysteine O-methyltransferase Ste14